MDPEIEWHQAQGLPHGGLYRGLDEVRAQHLRPARRRVVGRLLGRPGRVPRRRRPGGRGRALPGCRQADAQTTRRSLRPYLDSAGRQGDPVPSVPGHGGLGRGAADLIIDTAWRQRGNSLLSATPPFSTARMGQGGHLDEEGHRPRPRRCRHCGGGDERAGRPEGCSDELWRRSTATSTITLPFITPLTGGAGFLGAEQASWAKYAVKTLAPQYGLKVKLVLGDTPVEAGPAPALALAQKYIADKSVVAVLGPSTSGNAGATAKPFFAGRHRRGLPVGDAHRPDVSARRGDPLIGTPAFFRDVARDDSARARRTRSSWSTSSR